jgi:hypothetical protein
MEDLREKVYECTLGVEAHMICDLLARAGISARVDGELLAGAGGELPLGNAVKVRVAAERAAEARAVIEEWERAQPPEPAVPGGAAAAAAANRRKFKSPLWFLVGACAGAALATFALRGPGGQHGVDYDGDGHYEIQHHFAGNVLARTDVDRNSDGAPDVRWTYDLRGVESKFEADDDFDGRFEWNGSVSRGEVDVLDLDDDGDGRAEQTRHHAFGVLAAVHHHRDGGGPVVKRENYVAGRLASADFDADGDGNFERRVEYDRFGEPK